MLNSNCSLDVRLQKPDFDKAKSQKTRIDMMFLTCQCSVLTKCLMQKFRDTMPRVTGVNSPCTHV